MMSGYKNEIITHRDDLVSTAVKLDDHEKKPTQMLPVYNDRSTANVLGQVFLVKNKGNRRGNDPRTVRAKIENV